LKVSWKSFTKETFADGFVQKVVFLFFLAGKMLVTGVLGAVCGKIN